MADYEKHEGRLAEKIVDEIDKVGDILSKLDSDEGKVKHFLEEEKAIHEIKQIVRYDDRIAKDVVKDAQQTIAVIEDINDYEDHLAGKITNELGKLDAALAKLDEGSDSKVKSYAESHKALHEIREIAKNADEAF